MHHQVQEFPLDRKDQAVEAALAKLREKHLSVDESLAVTEFLSRVQPAEAYPVLVKLDKVNTWGAAWSQEPHPDRRRRAIPHLRRLGKALTILLTRPWCGIFSNMLPGR